MKDALGVSLICRNEERFVKDCIRGIFTQTMAPELLVVVDDGSTDDTPTILRGLAKEYPIYYERIEVPRVFKGWNIAFTINRSLHHILELLDAEWILRMDCDARLPNPRTFELMVEKMKKTPRLGVTGAYFEKKMDRHVCDAVRLYRRRCLEEIIKTNIIPQNQYPIMYGHDSFAILRANWLGWNTEPTDVRYLDLRPYRRNLLQWFQTGGFNYYNGFSLIHSIGECIRNIRVSPPIVGSLVFFFSWIVHHILRERITEDEYREFLHIEFDKRFINKLRTFLHGGTRELIH
jgi:glycosyltransferase involved in cell wall biosynthesis